MTTEKNLANPVCFLGVKRFIVTYYSSSSGPHLQVLTHMARHVIKGKRKMFGKKKNENIKDGYETNSIDVFVVSSCQ